NILTVLVIPASVDINSVWNVLPRGVHDATLQEIEERFSSSEARQSLFDGFVAGAKALHAAGCRTVYLNGSFVTDKPKPGDYDACWDPQDVDANKLDPVLLDFSDRRKRQKEKFGGEFFPASANADGSRLFVDFFQIDKHTGNAKGILRIQLPANFQ